MQDYKSNCISTKEEENMLRKQKDNMQNDGRFAFLIKDTFFCCKNM